MIALGHVETDAVGAGDRDERADAVGDGETEADGDAPEVGLGFGFGFGVAVALASGCGVSDGSKVTVGNGVGATGEGVRLPKKCAKIPPMSKPMKMTSNINGKIGKPPPRSSESGRRRRGGSLIRKR